MNSAGGKIVRTVLRVLLLSGMYVCGAAGCRIPDQSGGDVVRAVDLRTDYRVNPLGIDRFPPVLSWRMEAGGRQGAGQSAYQVQSASTREELLLGKTVWDSGLVESGESTQIPYTGPVLRPSGRVWWRVKIRDKAGLESEWSQPAWFEAGLLGDTNWAGAEWVGCTRDYKAPEFAPEELMGTWVSAGKVFEFISCFKDVVLPDKPVVSAMTYWGLSKESGPCSMAVNFDRLQGMKRSPLTRIMRPGSGFCDLAFYLAPGDTNRIEMRFEKPAKDVALTVGMRIVFADGEEMVVSSGDDWQFTGPSKEISAVTAVEPYASGKYRKAVMLGQTDLAPAWFRKKIDVHKGLVRARLYLCALGQGLAYLNGKPVDEIFFSSPQSDYEEFGYYTVHDITGLMNAGENTLAVLLDGGWYHEVGGFTHVFSYGRPGLKAMVQLEYADGKTEWVISNQDWQWKEGAICSANIYRGERIDYRRDHEEWKKAGAGSKWEQVQILSPLTPKTVAIDVNPVCRDDEIVPVKCWQTGPQTWLFDVGEMIHGIVRLKFNEPEGKTIRLRYSEYAEDGVLWNVPTSQWWCHGVSQGDEIISDGKPHAYESLFATKSFRFVEVSGLSRPPQPDDLVAIVVCTDAEVLASFESSDPMLNRLFQNGMRTFRNYVSHMFQDIPRERCLWGAESIYSEIPATYCFDLAPNHRLMNTLWWTGQTVRRRENIPGNVGVGKRLTTFTQSFTWSVTPLFVSSLLFEHYGDLEPAREYYGKIRHILRYAEETGEEGGTIPFPHDLSDHAPPKDIPRKPADNRLINALVFFEAQNRFARIADALGEKEDAVHARAHAEKIRTTIMRFYNAAKHTFGNGTHDSLALAYSVITDPDEQKRLAASMAGYYRANGLKFDGGFMSFEIYPQLSKYGYVDEAYEMLVNPDYPGPAWSVKTYDATSFWEAYYLDKDYQMFRGLNFIAYAHPIGWMITDLAGIRYAPGVPNGKRMLLAPAVPKTGKLKQTKASLKTPAGTVKSVWTLNEGLFKWEFTVPANVTAEVRIPAKDPSNVKWAEQMKQVRTEEGFVVYEAAAGTYSIQSSISNERVKNI